MSASSSSVMEKLSQEWQLVDPAVAQSPVNISPISHAVDVAMWSFAAGGIRLTCDRAVEVEFRQDVNGYYASSHRLHIFASGQSYEDCIRQFQHQVIYFYNDYSSLSGGDVVGLGVQLRELYLSHFSSAG